MGAFGFNRDDKSTKKMNRAEAKAERKASKRQHARDRRVRRESYDRGISIFALVLILLIVGALFSTFQQNDIPTFMSFIEFLSTAPSVPLDWAVIPQITADWGIFNWAVSTINVMSSIVNFFGYITKSGVNALIFFLWFLRFFIY